MPAFRPAPLLSNRLVRRRNPRLLPTTAGWLSSSMTSRSTTDTTPCAAGFFRKKSYRSTPSQTPFWPGHRTPPNLNRLKRHYPGRRSPALQGQKLPLQCSAPYFCPRQGQDSRRQLKLKVRDPIICVLLKNNQSRGLQGGPNRTLFSQTQETPCGIQLPSPLFFCSLQGLSSTAIVFDVPAIAVIAADAMTGKIAHVAPITTGVE